MNNYKGPKLRLTYRTSAPIADTPKHSIALERPKRRGKRRRRRQRSVYGLQLDEKQKVAFYYNVGDKQIQKCLKLAKKRPESTADALIGILETRLDNVIRRLGWARTIWQARQVVVHGHILVNGRKLDRPGRFMVPGDKIRPKEKSRKLLGDYAAAAVNVTVPPWLSREEEELAAQVVAEPKREDVQLPFELDSNMVVEYFSR